MVSAGNNEKAQRDPGDRRASRGWHSRGYLPHFESASRIQHVTVHLADSLPKSAIERVDQRIASLSEGQRAVERRRRLHDWIDAGHGACLLEQPKFARVVQEAFHFFDGERYRLFAWVVMPNHFHVLFQPINDWSMAETVASWKRFTATQIKAGLRGICEEARQEPGDPEVRDIVERAGQEPGDPGSANLDVGISEPLWPREYWDRYIRNEKHFRAVITYIEQNPVKAGLCSAPGDWKWSSAADSGSV